MDALCIGWKPPALFLLLDTLTLNWFLYTQRCCFSILGLIRPYGNYFGLCFVVVLHFIQSQIFFFNPRWRYVSGRSGWGRNRRPPIFRWTIIRRAHGIMSLTRFPVHGIMSLRHWLNHWLNDIMPCAGKCVNDNMPCAWIMIMFSLFRFVSVHCFVIKLSYHARASKTWIPAVSAFALRACITMCAARRLSFACITIWKSWIRPCTIVIFVKFGQMYIISNIRVHHGTYA